MGSERLNFSNPIKMKLSENENADNKFKFNPCALPFIPSVDKKSNVEKISGFDALNIRTEQRFWNHTLNKPECTDLVDENQFRSDYLDILNSSLSKILWEKALKDDFNQSNSEKELSSWFQDDEVFNCSQGPNSVCGGSWSGTPVSSISPPLNEEEDRDSISCDSLSLSYLPSDLIDSPFGANLLANLPQDQSDDNEKAPSQKEDEEPGSDVMQYYSLFGTGISNMWLGSGKSGRKESHKSEEENKRRGSAVEEKDFPKIGNVWNIGEPITRDRPSLGESWMQRLTSVDSNDSLFLRSESHDTIEDQMPLPSWQMSPTIGPLHWPQKTRPQEKYKRNCIVPEKNKARILDDALLSALLRDSMKSEGQGIMDQFAERKQSSPASGNHVNSTQKSFQPHSRLQYESPSTSPYPTNFYRQSMMNPAAAVPVFYVPGPGQAVHGLVGQHPFYTSLMPHGIPLSGFLNMDYYSHMPLYYPNFEQPAYINLGNKVPGFAALSRQSGPALELHQQLDQCYDQFRQLENERKKTEAEMARQHPGKVVTSDNSMPVPPMPPNPSRIDRLIIEVLREHSRVVTLVSRMEQLRGLSFQPSLLTIFDYWLEGAHMLQTCRKNEIINRKRYRLDSRGLLQKEKDVLALANSLSDLAVSIQKARTALWCAIQLASIDLPEKCIKYANEAAKLSCDELMLEARDEFGDDDETGNSPPDVEADINVYENEADNEFDHEGFEDELDQQAYCDDYSVELDRETDYDSLFEAGKESDYESYTEVGSDIDGKVYPDDMPDGDNFQLEESSGKLFFDEPCKESDYESCGTETGKDLDYKGSIGPIGSGAEEIFTTNQLEV